jgi:hypothetical protein
MPPPWQIEFDEAFWDSLIQIPGWPESRDHLFKLIRDLAVNAVMGDPVAGTAVFIAKIVAILSDESRVRLVLYFGRNDETGTLIMLFVDDLDNPQETFDLPRRLPKNH